MIADNSIDSLYAVYIYKIKFQYKFHSYYLNASNVKIILKTPCKTIKQNDIHFQYRIDNVCRKALAVMVSIVVTLASLWPFFPNIL